MMGGKYNATGGYKVIAGYLAKNGF